MEKFFNKILSWYFTRRALPYWTVLIIDIIICYLSGIFVFWFYYHGAVTLGNIVILTKTILVYMIFNLIGFRVFHTYSGIIRYSSFVDLQCLGMAQALSCFLALIFHYIIYPYHTELQFIPLEGRQIIAMYGIATVLMWAERVLVKSLFDISLNDENGKRTLIYGVDSAAIGLAKNIRNIKPTDFQLKGFISPDKHYSGHILMGEKVYKIGTQLNEVIGDMNIQAVLVSPPHNNDFRADQRIQDMLISAGVKIYMVTQPKSWNAQNDKVQLHKVNIEDLLPRDEIKVDMTSIAASISGMRIMITGSAGSIGAELVRQIADYKPAELILIDQAETPQHEIRLIMARDYPDIKTDTYVADITDSSCMEQIFRVKRPQCVFHAAAYKHVPMMEDNPSESVHNNVWGTKIIADLSVKYGVEKFVMISTDKAVNPSSVMGCSKRICEIYCQSLNHWLDSHDLEAANAPKPATSKNQPTHNRHTQFVTTRFGNVLGSNGSVIPLFKKQIAVGGPVTVTHPDIIRYFMLISEACKLVLEAAVNGLGGEILVFDMGKPVKIVDLARRMIKLSGARNVEIKFTGLRPGEKLYEEVLANNESTLPSFNKNIRIAKVRQYNYQDVCDEIEELHDIANSYDNTATIRKMMEIVPEYEPLNSKYKTIYEHEQKARLIKKE